MSITVKLKSNYGQQAIYPVCDKAKLFAELSDKKTLTPATIELIKRLGYTVNVQQEVVTL
jgi:hypothetical protein